MANHGVPSFPYFEPPPVDFKAMQATLDAITRPMGLEAIQSMMDELGAASARALANFDIASDLSRVVEQSSAMVVTGIEDNLLRAIEIAEPQALGMLRGSSGDPTPAPQPKAQRERRKLTIYVRKGADEHERRISFTRPSEIPAIELLEHDIALDGNQALFSVYGHLEPSTDNAPATWLYDHPFTPEGEYSQAATLPRALAEAEKALIAFLSEHGYEVDFA